MGIICWFRVVAGFVLAGVVVVVVDSVMGKVLILVVGAG